MQNPFSTTISRNNFRTQPSEVKFTQNTCDIQSLQAIHSALISELEAITSYENWANQVSNENAKKVLREIRDEERVHAGELLTLIDILCPDETNFFNLGKEEVMKIIGNNSMSFKQ